MTDLRSGELTGLITQMVCNAPEWVRKDLAARESAVRVRAEETLAAMIAAALAPRESQPLDGDPAAGNVEASGSGNQG